jgi:hypothetical protein
MFNFNSDNIKEKTFWKWFQNNEDRIFFFEKNRDKIFDELAIKLHKIHNSLTFEFGPIENGKREIVISADGIKEAFSSVHSLKNSAPSSLQKFLVTYFRPRRYPISTVSFGEIKLSPNDIFIDMDVVDGKICLTLFIKNYTEDQKNKYAGAAFILLDQALGEYDVETKVGYIDFQPLETEDKLLSFNTFPKCFDEKHLEIMRIS